ncbi:MAG TPA: PAS domain S-box protein [Haliangiales bacterium]|nr:PAS domain S-box protein [Haliangiales bacterium]
MGHRALLVGGDPPARVSLGERIEACGFTTVAADGADRPDLIVVCGEAPELAALRVQPHLRDVPIIALPDAVPQAPVDGILFLHGHLAPQLRHFLRDGAVRRALRALRAAEHLMAGEDPYEGARQLLGILEVTLAVDRVALVVVAESPWILDDDAPRGINLVGFPTVERALASRALTAQSGLLAVPFANGLGALLLHGRIVLDDHEETLLRTVCTIFSATFNHTPPLEPRAADRSRPSTDTGRRVRAALRDRGARRERDVTRPIGVIAQPAEGPGRAIEQFEAYFEAAADGVVVTDADANILYVNRTAETLTGFAREGLVGQRLVAFVPEDQRQPLAQVVTNVIGGTNLDAFDLEMDTTSGDRLCVSVTTSTVLAQLGAAILSFRDVTAERVLEAELRKTKEFQERLIDSTVDAIIAADTQGKIILFNPGAERLFGWTTDEALAELAIDDLFPEGVGRQISRMLRTPGPGGVGRLEVTRREIVTRGGELVPVNMTASLIYEHGQEVATVAILSDLRERIRIEQRLLQAQEKLVVTEKQALVAELAGATAHELNQPLTSVILYVEMMLRKMSPGDPHHRAAAAIEREATRMAEIVRKIGKITKYETKQYVGRASILDLEKASEEE